MKQSSRNMIRTWQKMTNERAPVLLPLVIVAAMMGLTACGHDADKQNPGKGADAAIDSSGDAAPAGSCKIQHCRLEVAKKTACCFAEPQPGFPICCKGIVSAVETYACDPTGTTCYTFCDACRPAGWKAATRPDGGPDSAGTGNCYLGASFAQCPGPDKPALYCQPKKSGAACLWISNGLAMGTYTQPRKPACTLNTEWWPLGRFLYQYGGKPWTRKRAMSLKVNVQTSVKISSTAVICATCTPPWTTGDTPCNHQVQAFTEFPGTYVLRLHPTGLYGWFLELEVDHKATPPAARLCRLPFTDALACKVSTVQCAESGSVTLNAQPSSGAYKSIAGTFTAKFGAGTISGSFAPATSVKGSVSCKR